MNRAVANRSVWLRSGILCAGLAGLGLLTAPTAIAQEAAPRSFLSGSLGYSQNYGPTIGAEVFLDSIFSDTTTVVLSGSKDKRGYELKSRFAFGRDQVPPPLWDRPKISFDLTANAHSEPGNAYDTSLYGVAVNADWTVGKIGNLRASYRLNRSSLDKVAATTSPLIAAEAGVEYASGLTVTYGVDTIDHPLLPRSGYFVTATGQGYGLGGQAKWAAGSIAAGIARGIGQNSSFTLKGGLGVAQGFGGYTLRVLDRAMLGGETPRGYALGGIGPADVTGATVTHLGGQRYATLTAEFSTRVADLERGTLVGHVFGDAGSVWGLPKTTGGFVGAVDDSAFINTSVGVGISWTAPFGTVTATYAKPIKRRATDLAQEFQFGFSTRF